MTYESNGLTSLTLEQYRMAASYTTRVMMIHKVKLSRLSSEVDFVVCIFQILGLARARGRAQNLTPETGHRMCETIHNSAHTS